MTGKTRITGDSIRLETSSLCQLRCPLCITGRGQPGIIGRGYLKYKDFKKFVDTYPKFKNIELSNFGEMFLNPDLDKIIKYAYVKKIRLSARNGVNLNTINEKIIECMVKYGFTAMTVSIDAAANKTYKIYRKGGDLNRVIENIKRINECKKKYRTNLPELTWQFIIFGHNEGEIPLAKKMARKLNMWFTTKFNWNPEYSPIKNRELVRKVTGFASRDEYAQKTRKLYMPPCEQLWTDPQINWDGKLLGCCCNIWGHFGNVFESGLEKCLESEKYIYAKKMVLGKVKPKKSIPCYSCDVYKEMRSRKIFITLPLKHRKP